ncbi:MAG: tRNA/rRNA methyltransferase SpoU [Parcubacteria group bacterium Athens0714_26]|nr:MAG: tRNA/rRNA methyltransferase SpoU [Parcubacteria group bacterium Athens1014_26]TSD02604.1 MAG: tRNA/rRNA methyltransferase SpoU [Parcubacteria group bacterium Athens0714_26]
MVVILHNIRSLYNVGSIFRTADAVGVEKIYLCGITPVPVDRFGKIRPQLAKVALGAEKSVEWDASASSAQATSKLLDRLKEDGFKILAVEQDKKAVPYFKYKVKNGQLDKIALILGNEVNGLPSAILKKADKILEIPMNGKMVRQAHHPKYDNGLLRRKESLNVSVAAGVVLYRLKFGQ